MGKSSEYELRARTGGRRLPGSLQVSGDRPLSIVLAAVYFIAIFRLFRGKVSADDEGYLTGAERSRPTPV